MSENDLPALNKTSKGEEPFNDLTNDQYVNKINSKDINDKGKNEKEGNSLIEILLSEALKEFELRKENLKKEIEELSKKKLQLEAEQKSLFTGQSDGIARRVKGFQDYLVGALQELSQTTEHLELIKEPLIVQPSPLDENNLSTKKEPIETIPSIADTFKPDEKLIRECFEQFKAQPDFYAEPWKLRRSIDPRDLDLLEDWFFSMGGRGAQPSRGNRSKNVLVSAALISILGELYGDQFQTLILASQPERLGEWRRGLQDALGLEREDFGPNSGIVLFERAEGVVERADRLEEKGEVPLILVDSAEQSVEIPILQFPLWLAFAADAEELYAEEDLI